MCEPVPLAVGVQRRAAVARRRSAATRASRRRRCRGADPHFGARVGAVGHPRMLHADARLDITRSHGRKVTRSPATTRGAGSARPRRRAAREPCVLVSVHDAYANREPRLRSLSGSLRAPAREHFALSHQLGPCRRVGQAPTSRRRAVAVVPRRAPQKHVLPAGLASSIRAAAAPESPTRGATILAVGSTSPRARRA